MQQGTLSSIVVCEDDPSIQKLVRAALRTTGHDVRVGGDGVEGLKLIGERPPDLIITDVSMPNMDGFRFVDSVRSQEPLQAVPILFMTASIQRAAVEECFRHGGDAFLAKPFTMGDLREKVADLLSSGRSS